tara:strand:+ start:1336 stop:2328 length:993 start_codon:yes stop_codon:yes gene_type:complete
MTFRKIDFPCGKPEVNWYIKDCKNIPQFKSVYSIGFQIREIKTLKNVNADGQLKNPARSQGIDYDNVNKIQYSFINQGVDSSIMPPIILPDGTVIDGNNRVEAYRQIGAQYVLVYCVEINEGFTIDDVYDEVGLGMNNHLVSKPMTLKDCKVRLHRYFKRIEEPSLEKGVEWFESFNHFFSEKEVNDAVQDVIQKERVADTMSPYNKKSTAKYIEEKSLGNFIPLNVNVKDSRSLMHYLSREVLSIIDKTSKTGKVPELLGFLSNCEAEDAEEQRRKTMKLIKMYNKKFNNVLMLMKAAEEDGEDFELIRLNKWMAQITDVESGIITVDD